MRDPDATQPPGGQAARDLPLGETRAPARPRAEPLPERIAGFRILGLLGHGGMGTVYLAEQGEPLRRRVALKVIRGPRECLGAGFGARFESERQALALLGHPHIAQIFEAGTTADGDLWYSLEHIPGLPLTEYCDDRRLPLGQRIELFLEVCRAVQFAHERGILHRDLKPGNVLVREVLGRAVPKIIDFGLAKSLGEPLVERAPETLAGVVGTPAYMSPEAIEPELAKGALDARSDVYALGVILHELAIGVRPSTALPISSSDRLALLDGGQRQAMAKIRSVSVAGLAGLLRGGLDEILARALAPARDERTPSAAVLAEDLERWLAGERLRVGRSRPRRLIAFGLLTLLAILGALAIGLWARARTATAPIRSLAVLPFEDLSPGGDQGYLADGVAEALLFDLAQLRGVRVISRASAMRFRDRQLPDAEIARQLGVDALVEGAIVRSGPRVQVSAQLVDIRAGATRWSGQFERTLDDLLTLEREVARTIGGELRAALSAEDRARLNRPTVPVSGEALEAYLRGRAMWNQRTEVGVRRALGQFERAVLLAPLWAPGHVGIADCYALLPPYGGIPGSVAYPRALAAARRALALDPDSAEANTTLGLLLLEQSWDWQGAESSYRRAIELNPGYVTARQWYAELLSRAGRHEEALAQIRQAESLDPLSKIVGAVHGWALANARRWPEAEGQFRAVLALDPDFVPALGFLATVEMAEGRPERAIPLLEKAVAANPENVRYLSELAIAHARAGRTLEAEAELAALERRASGQPVPAFHLARLKLSLGRREEALADLERARSEGGVWMLFLRVDPLLDDVRADPRFALLERQVGISPRR